MNKKFARLSAAASVTLLGAVGSAQAAVPTEVSTALTDMKADGVTVALGFLVAVIAVKAIHMMRRG